MNTFYLAVLATLFLAAAATTAGAQRPSSKSVCAQPDKNAGDAVLTICKHERGMVPLPQPRLYLRLFADGRAEYERNPQVPEGDPRGYQQLIKVAFRVTPAELNEILCLGREPDFQEAQATYQRIYKGIDSSMKTTVTFRDGGREKKIVLDNYFAERDDNVEHYPSSLNALMDRAQRIWERANGIVRTVPTITFCELMLNRSKYLGKRVSIHADLEHHVNVTRDGKRRSIIEFLHDPECDRPELGKARTTEQLGIGYPDDQALKTALESTIARLRGEPYHGRARVLATGTLRTVPDARPDYVAGYEFEIADFKSIEPIILPYQGSLKNGWTFSDTFDHAGGPDIQLSTKLIPKIHHAARIEWRNTRYRLLAKPGRRHIVFWVVYVTTQMISPNRWNDTFTCEILELK